ncbi:MAG: hypothetical protein KAI66_04910, partial [Lentisphaeria bacterium]|nr:hypothetical protein [Lentisphaeria bacterium]
ARSLKRRYQCRVNAGLRLGSTRRISCLSSVFTRQSQRWFTERSQREILLGSAIAQVVDHCTTRQ